MLVVLTALDAAPGTLPLPSGLLPHRGSAESCGRYSRGARRRLTADDNSAGSAMLAVSVCGSLGVHEEVHR